MGHINNFIIFAGLKKHAPTIARKITACQDLVPSGLINKVHLHPYGDRGHNQYLITNRDCRGITLFHGILDKDCDDCLDYMFIKTVITRLIDHDFDTIYDPFCGNGSTALAALSLDKKFVGIDIDLERVAESARKYGEALNDSLPQ